MEEKKRQLIQRIGQLHSQNVELAQNIEDGKHPKKNFQHLQSNNKRIQVLTDNLKTIWDEKVQN